MKKYKVEISSAAQNDLVEIAGYLAERDHGYAVHYYELFMEKIRALTVSPESGLLTRDKLLRLRGYRMLPVESHIVFYVINVGTVELRRVLYAKRQYDGML